MGSRRQIISALAGVLGALTLAGCVVFEAGFPIAAQNGMIGSVRVIVKACASQTGGSPPPGSCPSTGNEGGTASTNKTQVFLAFRVPAGAGAPASFTSTSTGPNNTGPQLLFTLNLSYTSELQRLKPAPTGEQWFGYASPYVSYSATSGEQNFTASADFGLPKHANGSPFAGPFTYRAVVGGRESTLTSPDPNESVDCPTLTDGWSNLSTASGTEDSICVDDPSAATLATDVTVVTRDAGIIAGSPVSSRPGKTATVPFTFAYAGTATPSAAFAFAGSTTVSGAKATPSTTSLAPGTNSSTPISMSVPIPRSTKPGIYTVTLTAGLADGETRTGTAQIAVGMVCKVPGLKGKTVSKAKKLLKNANCKLGKVKSKHSKTPVGKIIKQKPKKGTLLDPGSKVSVTKSLGP